MATSYDLSLFKLADILQVPIKFDGKNVTGQRSAEWQSVNGLKIPLQLIATAIFLADQVGLIVHVLGNMYLMAAHFPEKQGLSAYVIDRSLLSKNPEELINRKMNLREVMDELKASVVKSFYHNGTEWKTLRLPK